MRTARTKFGIRVVPEALPNWWPAVGESVQVNTNSVTDLASGDDAAWNANEGVISGVFKNWNGGVFASGRGKYGRPVRHGGGHNAYFGNEIYECDLETRLWSRPQGPFPPPADWNVDTSTFGELSPSLHPGWPCSTHNYDQLVYRDGELFLMWHVANHELGGNFTHYTHRCDIATGVWSRGGFKGSHGQNHHGFTIYDPSRDVIWGGTQDSFRLYRYDPTDDTWTNFVHGGGFNLDSVAAYYPDGDAMIVLDNRAGHSFKGLDLANPTASPVTLTETGTPNSATAAGIVWVPRLGEFACYDWGNTVYFVKPPAGDWKTGTWTWRSETISPGIAYGAADGQSGPYSQFNHVDTISSANYFVVTTGLGNCHMFQTTPDGP